MYYRALGFFDSAILSYFTSVNIQSRINRLFNPSQRAVYRKHYLTVGQFKQVTSFGCELHRPTWHEIFTQRQNLHRQKVKGRHVHMNFWPFWWCTLWRYRSREKFFKRRRVRLSFHHNTVFKSTDKV